MKKIHRRDANKYFGMNHIQDNFVKGFVYKDVKEYDSLKEWLDNICICMNENIALETPNGNRACFVDKRSGVYFSLMGFWMPKETQKELMESEGACKEFLSKYYFDNK